MKEAIESHSASSSGATWRAYEFEELIAWGKLLINDGYRAKLDELGGDGPIFLRSGLLADDRIDLTDADRFQVHLLPRLSNKTSQTGDVLVTTKGNSIGRVGQVFDQMPSMVYSPHLSFWRALDNQFIDPQFLYAWSRGPEFQRQLRAMCFQTDMAPYLSLVDQKRLRITLPPLPEQRAIAHILGTLDDKIELNRRLNQTLEAIARALFKSWFVDFDPVRAKAAGRQPEGMDAATAALFPSEFADSELGEIPRGWGVGTIADLIYIARRSLNPSLFPGETFDHYSIPAFDDGRTPVSELGSGIKSNKTLVEPNGILISKLNPQIPRVWLPDLAPDRRSICSTEFLIIVPRWPETRLFVYSLLTSDPFSQSFASLVTGTTGSHQRVSPESFLAMTVIMPLGELAERFSELIVPLVERVAANRRESLTLSRTRDTLLPKLLSGEFRVPDCEVDG